MVPPRYAELAVADCHPRQVSQPEEDKQKQRHQTDSPTALASNITQEFGGARRRILRDHRVLSTSKGNSAIPSLSTINIH